MVDKLVDGGSKVTTAEVRWRRQHQTESVEVRWRWWQCIWSSVGAWKINEALGLFRVI